VGRGPSRKDTGNKQEGSDVADLMITSALLRFAELKLDARIYESSDRDELELGEL
jgi:hypothetical protein